MRNVDAGDRQQHAEDRRAGRAEADRNHALETVADRAALSVAQRQEQPGDCHAEAEPERPHVDECAARDDQRAERDKDERRQVRGGADGCLHGMRDRPTAEPEPQDSGDEDARADEPEPDELGMRLRDVEFAARLRGSGAS